MTLKNKSKNSKELKTNQELMSNISVSKIKI